MSRRKKPRLYLRNGTWWVWFYGTDGTRVRKSTHQRERGLAEVAGRQLEREHLEAEGRPATLTVKQALANYLAATKRRERAEATLSYYVNKGRQLTRHIGAHDVNTLKLADLEKYLDARRVDASAPSLPALAKELGMLRAALRYAKRHGLYLGDVEAIMPEEIRGAYVPRERVLAHEEYAALLLALGPPPATETRKGQRGGQVRTADRRDYLVAFVGLGVRDSELYRIEASDVASDQVHVRGTKTDRADRWIPLRREVTEVLVRRAETADGPLFPKWRNVRRDLIDACERAEISPVSPNDLRRTFATWLAEAGVPEAVTAALLGHASSDMVRRVYTRIGRAAQRAAIASLPALTERRPEQNVADVVTNGVTKQVDSGETGGTYGTPGIETSVGDSVPRDGIEPPTRGFSGLGSTSVPASVRLRRVK